MSQDQIQDDSTSSITQSDPTLEAAYLGAKWGSSTLGTGGGTVTWSIASHFFSNRYFAYDGSFTSFPSGYLSEIQRAFNAWESVANIHFVQATDTSTVDIRLGVGSIDGPSQTLGLTHYNADGSGSMTMSDIELDSAENWTVGTSGFSIFSVAVHEIGHAIGLAHDTNPAAAVMDPYYAGLQALTSADIAAVRDIYGAAAGGGGGSLSGHIGTNGNDSLIGTTGDDLMFGYAGNDTVYGAAGNDTLVGGAGKDLLTGAGGLDYMRFTTLSDSGVAFAARDAVNTFAHGDKIDLSALDANTQAGANQAFHFQSAFNGTPGQLVAVQVATNSFLIEADVNGDNHYDFSLNVYTAPGFGTFHSWDFIL